MEVSNEEQFDVSKHAGGCQDQNFFLDEVCKVEKSFQERKNKKKKKMNQVSSEVLKKKKVSEEVI